MSHEASKNFINIIIFLILFIFISLETPQLSKKDIETIKKGIFLDSYAISLNKLSLEKDFKNEISEKNAKKEKRKLEDLLTLKDVGFFPYDLGKEENTLSGYTNIFNNIGKDHSKYIIYPYGFKYKKKNKEGLEEEKEQLKGGFFSLESKITPSSIENIKNITNN